MTKLIQAIDRAKVISESLSKYTGGQSLVTIYKFRGEKKIRSNSIDLRGTPNSVIVVLAVLTYYREEWTVEYITKEAKAAIFAECLQEAESKLVTKYFIPELDNLAAQDIASVLMKIIIEQDLLDEGEIKTEAGKEIPNKSANAWRGKANGFIRKYRPYVEPEQIEEFKNYMNY